MSQEEDVKKNDWKQKIASFRLENVQYVIDNTIGQKIDPVVDKLSKKVVFRHVVKFISMLNDDVHPVSQVWSIFIFLISIYMMLTVPFRIGYLFEESFIWIPFDLFFDLMLWIDVLLKMLAPYEDRNSTRSIDKYRKTIVHFFLSFDGAIKQVTPILPLDWMALIFRNVNPSFFRVHRIFLFVHIGGYFKKLEFILSKVNPAIIRVSHFLAVVLFLGHWIACAWFLLVRWEGDDSIYWTLTNILLEPDTDLFFRYTLGLYWSLLTISGYGGYYPITNVETIFSIIVAFLGVVVYATIIGIVGNLVTNLDANAIRFRERMDKIDEYMNYRSLDKSIQRSVRMYYDYLWNSRKGLDETKILEDLPDFLKMSVALHLNREIIRKVDLFRNADDTFVSEIVVRLRPRVSLPDSYIIRLGETGREMYFISRGEADVVIANDIVVHRFKDGDFFGEIALIYNVKRTASIRAVEFCDLFVLMKEDFDSICLAYPEEALKIKTLAKDRYEQTQGKKANDDSEKKDDKSEITASDDDQSEHDNPSDQSDEKEISASDDDASETVLEETT